MEVTTERFIRKPLYVDAVRVKADNFDEIVAWCQGEVLTDEVPGTGTTKKYIKVRVHNPKNPRQTKAFIGDWLLYTERGYKVYTNKAFRQAFDLVEGAEPKVESAVPTRLGNVSSTPEEKDQRAVQALDAPLSEDEEVDVQSEEETLEALEERRIQAAEEDAHTTPQGEPHEYVEATPQAIADTVDEQQPPVDDEEVRQEVTGQAQAEVEASMTTEPVELDEEDATGKIEQTGQPEPVSEQVPEDAAAGKRVLSEEEQRQMGPDAVREMVRSGDVVLVQDLAA